MVSADSLDGVMAWVRREEWREAFAACVQRHMESACSDAGVAPGALGEIIGDEAVGNVFGCAFEDFLASGPDDRNVTVAYLKRRGWTESPEARAYLAALRASRMGLYEVSDIVAGESFLARDLVCGGQPVRVIERTATRTLSQWDRIAARIVTVQGKTQLTGVVLAFDHRMADVALEMLGKAHRKARAAARKAAGAHGHDPDGAPPAPLPGVDATLALSAPLFSTLWLQRALAHALRRDLPDMRNSDGEPLEFVTLHFPLLSKPDAAAVRTALDALPDLCMDGDDAWSWLDSGARPAVAAEGAVSAATFPAAMGGGPTILGHVALDERTLTLQVNSEGRAARGQAMLEAALAGLISTPLAERRSVADMLRDRPRSQTRGRQTPDNGPGSSEPGSSEPGSSAALPPDEARRLVHQTLSDHYRKLLDEPVPVLANRSPRQAVRTAKGRDRVVAWLKVLENRSAQGGPDDPMGTYDFTWMWEELGVTDRRN